MNEISGTMRRLAAIAVCGSLAVAVAGCSAAPDLDRLAPTMQKLTTETPQTRRPEQDRSQFPNINIAPDRPSVLRSATEREVIEKELEAQGSVHVKDADKAISDAKPAAATSIVPAEEPSTDPGPPLRPALPPEGAVEPGAEGAATEASGAEEDGASGTAAPESAPRQEQQQEQQQQQQTPASESPS